MYRPLIVALVAATLLVPTRASALENEDLLALVAMPLAVAAVSEIADVPADDLIDVVTLLNNAAVPPAQFIETVRYIPVALVTEDNDFVEFVRVREQEGVRGTALVTSIAERLQLYGIPDADIAVTRLRTIDVVDEDFVPKPVRLRLAEVKRHPRHPLGGPPGQLKKAAGTRVVSEVVVDKEGGKERKIRPHKVESHTRVAEAKHKDHGKGHGNGKGKGKG